ncbi:MAG TPA: hypothetical protein VGM50_21105 [Gemmatimonadaceae bacterium]
MRFLNLVGVALLIAIPCAGAHAQHTDPVAVLEAFRMQQLRITSITGRDTATQLGRPALVRNGSAFLMGDDRSALTEIPIADISRIETMRQQQRTVAEQEVGLAIRTATMVGTFAVIRNMARHHSFDTSTLLLVSGATVAVQIPLNALVSNLFQQHRWVTVFAK